MSGMEESLKLENFKPWGTKVVIRYPGGKQRFLPQLLTYLPKPNTIEGRFLEPFFGGGAVFFALQAKPAILSDKNPELVDLYKGIRRSPSEVWKLFSSYPSNKRSYYCVRSANTRGWSTLKKAAQTLYLNRTCFKGMWRQNSKGMFNVGYGGQSRRWTITEEDLKEVSRALRGATLLCADFQAIIDGSVSKDFLFVDPPYHPGRRESRVEHYMFGQFTFESHKRLADTLRRASRRGVQWAMTNSSHPDVLSLFSGHRILPFEAGVGESPGSISKKAGEVLVLNY